MTLPTIYPTNFNGTTQDFTKAKADRSGAIRSSVFTVTVPSGTASATVIGLVPVKKGARLHLPACQINTAELDSTSTLTAEIGVVYSDTTNNTSVPAEYVGTGSTAPQSASAFTLLTTNAAHSYVVTGDGWVAVTTQAAATNTSGSIQGVIAISYDSSLL